jgi:hypothetical protein
MDNGLGMSTVLGRGARSSRSRIGGIRTPAASSYSVRVSHLMCSDFVIWSGFVIRSGFRVSGLEILTKQHEILTEYHGLMRRGGTPGLSPAPA